MAKPNTLPCLIFGIGRREHSVCSMFQWRLLFAQGVTSPLALKRQQSITPCITDREQLPDMSSDKEPSSPHLSDKGQSSRENSFRHRGGLRLGTVTTSIIFSWCSNVPTGAEELAVNIPIHVNVIRPKHNLRKCLVNNNNNNNEL